MKDIDQEMGELLKLCQKHPVKISSTGEVVEYTPQTPNNPSVSELQKAMNSTMLSMMRLSEFKMPELHMFFDPEGKYMAKNSNLKATRLMKIYGNQDLDDTIVGDVIVFPSWYII